MKILGIETSCDETACAVVEDGRHVVSESMYSQIELHRVYGGVVPEIASRAHAEKLPLIVPATIEAAGGREAIDAVAVTYGPGLVGALLTGVSYAKALAFAWDVPLVGVDHIAGHIAGVLLSHQELEPPFLCLVVSGGHTEIVLVRDYTDLEVMGATRDDAAGEAIDKAARLLGLPYPGGPHMQELAMDGDSCAFSFPRSFRGESHLDFSFSGPKTAAVNLIHRLEQKGACWSREDMAASFLGSVVNALVDNVKRAMERTGMRHVALAGGVSANLQLRSAMKTMAEREGFELFLPELRYCTDNGAMIASAAYYAFERWGAASLDLNAVPGADLEKYTHAGNL